MSKSNYVVFHDPCNDGFGAAWAFWLTWGDHNTEYVGATYGQPYPEIPDNKHVYMVDFSYPRADLEALYARSASLIVIDHHQTAQEDLEGLDYVIFDLEKSGARLAWEYRYPASPVPDLIRYIEDRDLWRFALPESKAVTAALYSHPRDFKLWTQLADKSIMDLAREGRPILRYKEQLIESMCQYAELRDFNGYRVPVVNASCEWSDVANRLLQLYPDASFAAAYFDKPGKKRQWSLRSRPGFAVNRIAQEHGGGGHPTAAGFVEDRT